MKGRKIEVYFATEINKFLVKFPYTDNLNLKILKPKDAAFIIRQALLLGWNPEEKGSPIRFDWVDEELIRKD